MLAGTTLAADYATYLLEQLTKRQQEARKVNLDVLLRATYEGRRINP